MGSMFIKKKECREEGAVGGSSKGGWGGWGGWEGWG